MTFPMMTPFSMSVTASRPPTRWAGTPLLQRDHAPPAPHHHTLPSPSARGRGRGEGSIPPSRLLSQKVGVGRAALSATHQQDDCHYCVRDVCHLFAEEFSKDSCGQQLSGMGSPEVSASPGDESAAMTMQQTGKKKARLTAESATRWWPGHPLYSFLLPLPSPSPSRCPCGSIAAAHAR